MSVLSSSAGVTGANTYGRGLAGSWGFAMGVLSLFLSMVSSGCGFHMGENSVQEHSIPAGLVRGGVFRIRRLGGTGAGRRGKAAVWPWIRMKARRLVPWKI